MNNELNEIVQNFTEIAERKDFVEMCKNNKLLKKDTKKLMFILEQLFKNIGVTEYSSVDRGYSGDELLEKYKHNVQKSWKGKKEKQKKKDKQNSLIDKNKEIENGTDKNIQYQNNKNINLLTFIINEYSVQGIKFFEDNVENIDVIYKLLENSGKDINSLENNKEEAILIWNEIKYTEEMKQRMNYLKDKKYENYKKNAIMIKKPYLILIKFIYIFL